ncbi:UBC-like protein [Sanghuangporus baumii]|uniref:UBC-like protein n=1 Tax=Sanghuangporus baumii TaxID=108892 RepID=A0A9Q5HQF8_SANBA|nr:UBC-like protein [Sanghuangporus baumii]
MRNSGSQRGVFEQAGLFPSNALGVSALVASFPLSIIGLQGFFLLKGQAAMGIGSMEAPGSERRRLAKLSRDWVCPHCKIPNRECLPDPPAAVLAGSGSDSQSQDQPSSELSCTKGADGRPSLNKVPSTEGDGRSNLTISAANTNPEEKKDRFESAEHGKETARTGTSTSTSSASPSSSASLASSDSDVRSTGASEQQQQQRARNSDGRESQSISTGTPSPSDVTAKTGNVSASSSQPVEERQMEIVSVSTSAGSVHVSHSRPSTSSTTTSTASASSSRPPILLDGAIYVLLVLVAALLARKVLSLL